MSKRLLNISILAVLALDLSGATAFAFSADCGMSCCQPSDHDGTGTFEAPSCCDTDGVTCGFETGLPQRRLYTATTHTSSAGFANFLLGRNLPAATSLFEPVQPAKPFPTPESTGPPSPAPIFLSNAAILC